MPKKCFGRYTREDAVAEETTPKSTLEDIAKAGSDFPYTFSDDGFSEESAIALALQQAKKAADEWCGKRDCAAAVKCRVDELDVFDYEIIAVDKTTVLLGKDEDKIPLDYFTAIIKVKSIKCVCTDIKPIIARPKDEKECTAVRLKKGMQDIGLTDKQIKRVNESKCQLRRFAKPQEEKQQDGSKKEKIHVYVQCAGTSWGTGCELGQECMLILYKIGDNKDNGAVQKTPFDLSQLPEGHFLVCECRQSPPM